jgi:hypothetical protein
MPQPLKKYFNQKHREEHTRDWVTKSKSQALGWETTNYKKWIHTHCDKDRSEGWLTRVITGALFRTKWKEGTRKGHVKCACDQADAKGEPMLLTQDHIRDCTRPELAKIWRDWKQDIAALALEMGENGCRRALPTSVCSEPADHKAGRIPPSPNSREEKNYRRWGRLLHGKRELTECEATEARRRLLRLKVKASHHKNRLMVRCNAQGEQEEWAGHFRQQDIDKMIKLSTLNEKWNTAAGGQRGTKKQWYK